MPASDPQSLRGALDKLGLVAHLDFLFAVFEGGRNQTPGVHVFYRGRVVDSGAVPMSSSVRIIPLAEIPFALVRDDPVRSMLQRYVRERSEDAFGIYMGDTEAGTVQSLASHH